MNKCKCRYLGIEITPISTSKLHLSVHLISSSSSWKN